jgi:hypothetical protein
MAEAGYALLYQYRVGLGYLATVRKDGGPRVHPVCPVIARDGLSVSQYGPRPSWPPVYTRWSTPGGHEP